MKRKFCVFFVAVFVICFLFSTIVLAGDASLLNNNTLFTSTNFVISDTGMATVVVNYDGYSGITSGATITIKIEKRNFLLFWSDVIDETITVEGVNYSNEINYQLEDKGTYRCTVVYTISGTGGADDVLTFEDTDKYE